MAASPQTRVRFRTDVALLRRASTVTLNPPVDKAVFYADDEGARLARQFVAADPTYKRIDDLLLETPEGRALLAALTSSAHAWDELEEVWWELSWRLARRAEGRVHVFGPRRLMEDRPLSEFRHKYATGGFAHTVFEKVELPELEANPRVTHIFVNGQLFA